jgi:hypothetical protein
MQFVCALRRFIESAGRGRRPCDQPEEIPMNASLFTCDRATHLKIVAVALVAAILVAVGGFHARSIGDAGSLTAGAKTSSTVVKAGKPAIYSTRNESAVR